MGRPPPLPDERAIVEKAQKGDKRAFEKIYRAYAPVLFSYVLMPMLSNRDDAQDCVREAFIAAHKNIAKYEWRGESIFPWLKVLAKNKARDLLRASGRRQRLRGAFSEHMEVGERSARNPAEERLQQQGLRTKIDGVLETINPRYARVLRLRLLEDRPRDECAELMEVKIGTLDVLMYRAVRAFRAACEKQGMEFGMVFGAE